MLENFESQHAAESDWTRWMLRSDMRRVVEIERRSFEFPWTEEEFLLCQRQRNVIGIVYETRSFDIHGFCLYELNKKDLRILNIAVAPEVRRTGIGMHIVQKLTRKLAVQRRDSVFVRVRETNLAAQKFFSKAGFRCTSVDRNYFTSGCTEDAYNFEYGIETDRKPLSRSNRILRFLGKAPEDGKAAAE